MTTYSIRGREPLKARNRSPRTINIYRESAQQLIDYLRQAAMPTAATKITREHIEAYLADLQDRVKPGTVSVRYRSLQQLFRWLTVEREITKNPMVSMHPPHVPEQPVPVIQPDIVERLLNVCDGTKYEARRDSAIITLLLDTGMRRAELAGMAMPDVDFDHSTALVTGKGNRQRLVAVGANSNASDGSLRARPAPASPSRLVCVMARAERRPDPIPASHRYSSVAAPKQASPAFMPTSSATPSPINGSRSGGTEGDLMQLGGWKSRQMLDRYGRSAVAERARNAHRKLSPADRLLGER